MMHSRIISKLITLAIVTAFVLELSHECWAGRKKWVSSWDFSNKRNWKEGSLPCPGRPATFGRTPQYSIYLDSKVAVGSLSFPYDTELIFSSETTLSLSEKRDDTCSKNLDESVFINGAADWWWDPDSWECSEDRRVECNFAVPHINRVPCIRDHVELPHHEDSLYRIIFTSPTPIVRSLSLGSENVTTSQLSAFATSKKGSGRIKKVSAFDAYVYVYIEDDYPCNDITGCQCHQSSPEKEICRIKSHKCPLAKCLKPVRMKGFCCDLCGVDVAISHNGSLQLSLVRDLLKTVSRSREGNGVDMHAAKMESQFLHAYFLGNTEDADYLSAASKFISLFKNDYNSNDYYKVSTVSSKGGYYALKRTQEESKSNMVKGLVSFFVILVLLVAGFVFYRHRKYGSNFSFRRFSLHGRRESTLMSTPLPSFSSRDGLRFINPGYEVAAEASEISRTMMQSSSLTTVPEVPELENPSEREKPPYSIRPLKDSAITFSEMKEREDSIGILEDTSDDTEVENGAEEVQLISIQNLQGSKVEELGLPTEEDEEEMLEQLAQSRAKATKIAGGDA